MTDAVRSQMALAEELATFGAHRTELVGSAAGKFVLIRGSGIVGTYESERDAISEGYRRFGNVPFLVKQIEAVDQPQHFVSNLLCI